MDLNQFPHQTLLQTPHRVKVQALGPILHRMIHSHRALVWALGQGQPLLIEDNQLLLHQRGRRHISYSRHEH